jgi:hypothetical protein
VEHPTPQLWSGRRAPCSAAGQRWLCRGIHLRCLTATCGVPHGMGSVCRHATGQGRRSGQTWAAGEVALQGWVDEVAVGTLSSVVVVGVWAPHVDSSAMSRAS